MGVKLLQPLKGENIKRQNLSEQKQIWVRFIFYSKTWSDCFVAAITCMQMASVKSGRIHFYLPLLICWGECLEWSEGSDRLSGERERLLRCLSCDRLEWSDAREWISEMSGRAEVTSSVGAEWSTHQHVWLNHHRWTQLLTPHSPSLSEALAEGMLSSRSGMLRRVARSSLWTTIFSLPFDLSISFLASIKERFSVTVPLIWDNPKKEKSAFIKIVIVQNREHPFQTLELYLSFFRSHLFSQIFFYLDSCLFIIMPWLFFIVLQHFFPL